MTTSGLNNSTETRHRFSVKSTKCYKLIGNVLSSNQSIIEGLMGRGDKSVIQGQHFIIIVIQTGKKRARCACHSGNDKVICEMI